MLGLVPLGLIGAIATNSSSNSSVATCVVTQARGRIGVDAVLSSAKPPWLKGLSLPSTCWSLAEVKSAHISLTPMLHSPRSNSNVDTCVRRRARGGTGDDGAVLRPKPPWWKALRCQNKG